MRFTQQDFEGALDFVRDLYDQRGLADYADRAMSALLRIVGADRVVYGDFDVERQLARLSMQPAIVKEADGTVNGVVNGAISVLERDFGQHPLYRYFLQTGDGRPQKMTAVMTRTQYRHYCERDEFAGQLGARFQMGLFFAAGPTVVTAIVATRTQRDFSERERALMSRLYPHLVQAFRNTASLNQLCRDVDGLVQMLEGPTSSVVVLAGSGRVKRWSEQAKNWIAQYCRTPFPAEANRLPDCFAEWYQRQLTLAARETLLPSPREPLVVEKNARQLTVQFVPDHFRDEHLLLLNEKQRDSTWSALGDHGLTPRQSEVLAWVAKGKTNAEIGVILDMSARTVQKHLEHVYAKLGVESRTTATLKMLGIRGD
ncbi:MAG TPA: helix-turn-helix transcriptional regulator [Burkholderiales bacterium]|nr:helix-turn-helix transcriptional regulator [Burkholderiales bacterium]